MRKIMIIGSGGAGKSTFARQLGARLDIDVYHLDALFLKPGWVGSPRTEQKDVQHELVRKQSWIIDGNYGGTMDIRLQEADTIIFLDMPRLLCLFRVLKRRWMYHNKSRPDMGEGCKEKVGWAFIKWVQYRETRRPKILSSLMASSQEQQVIVIQSPRGARHLLATIEANGNTPRLAEG
ncbi:DNA topology modulation protein [Thalassobacillus sp. CUG 92003]|uniref:DNA topology modulation protein n=1 Tax=Thalassobacillus sp. CUG 92003 TaxID=2736641 RepID=UPI0015E73F34|nr:DNA topology modulation protein [Thalassobacillus sp. CUG 92003]